MRIKAFFAALVPGAILAAGSVVPAAAQVVAAARVPARPIGVGVGFSSYDLDYGPGRRMEGLSARGSFGLYRGLGIDASARSIFMFTPSSLTRMQQNTFLGGVYYESKPIFHVRPFARMAGGLGTIEFPSRNPAYTRDSYTVFAPSAGIEVPIRNGLYARAEYEYQFWRQYHGPRDLNPQGYTIGFTYYLRGMRQRSR